MVSYVAFLHWWASNHEATNRETVGGPYESIFRNRLLGAVGNERCWLCRESTDRQGQGACASGREQGLVEALSRRSYPFRVVPGARLPR
jgi:hypothetical protein